MPLRISGIRNGWQRGTLTNRLTTCAWKRVETAASQSRMPRIRLHAERRYIIVVFEWIDDDTILPVTAYEVPEP